MKRPMHMIHMDADKVSALVSRCTEQRERAEKAEARIRELEGDLAGRALMDAEGEAFLPEVVEQLQARIEELEETDTGKLRAEVNGTIRVQMSYIAKLEARIEALERWGEAAEQALVYAATVTDNPMVDKICMDHAIEWAALARSPEEADGG